MVFRIYNGQETLEDDQYSGRPSKSWTEKMRETGWQMIQSDHRITTVDVEQEVDIFQRSIHVILSKDLKMKH